MGTFDTKLIAYTTRLLKNRKVCVNSLRAVRLLEPAKPQPRQRYNLIYSMLYLYRSIPPGSQDLFRPFTIGAMFCSVSAPRFCIPKSSAEYRNGLLYRYCSATLSNKVNMSTRDSPLPFTSSARRGNQARAAINAQRVALLLVPAPLPLMMQTFVRPFQMSIHCRDQ